MSVAQNVLFRLNRKQLGTPFHISSFYDLGSETSVQKAFSRMVQDGVVARLTKGFYARPKPVASLPGIKSTASAHAVACVWAKMHDYKLVSQGIDSAYRLGFQTQAPIRAIYWSDGPSRHFKVGNDVVDIRHRSANFLHWEGLPEGILLRALMVTPAEAVNMKSLTTAFDRLALNILETKSVIQKLYTTSLPKAWRSKLELFEQSLC